MSGFYQGDHSDEPKPKSLFSKDELFLLMDWFRLASRLGGIMGGESKALYEKIHKQYLWMKREDKV